MSYSLYTLTADEQSIITNLNQARSNVLLVIMQFGSDIGVSDSDIQLPMYNQYLDALGGVYNPLKVVQVEPPTI